MKFLNFCLLSILYFSFPANAQPQKRPMTVEDLVEWQRVTDRKISEDGKWVAVKEEPWQGDPAVVLYGSSGREKIAFPLGNAMTFSPSSGYLAVSLVPSVRETDSLKTIKTAKDKMPMNKLLLYRTVDGSTEIIDSVRSYKISGNTDWLAYQRGREDSTLHVRSFDGQASEMFGHVTGFGFAEKGNSLYFISQPKDEELTGGVYVYRTDRKESLPVLEKKGEYKQVSFDKPGEKIAFLFKEKDAPDGDGYELYINDGENGLRMAAGKTAEELPEGWIISGNGRLNFSDNSRYLYLGIAPPPHDKDTTTLADYRPNVHVWTWDEPVLYSQQERNLENDLKKTYSAVLHTDSGKLVPLATEDIPWVTTTQSRDASFVLGTSSKPYELEYMWTGRSRTDLYTIDISNGQKETVVEGLPIRPTISPGGRYALWYLPADSSWYSYSISDRELHRLTTPVTFAAWNEDNDVPDLPSAHGVAGWTEEDRAVLIYDRYDIWSFDPEGKKDPVRLTANGRTDKIRYRYLKLDSDEQYIDTGKTHLLSGFDETTKGSGIYSTSFRSPGIPKTLIAGDFFVRNIVKAKKAERLIYSCETFQRSPDIYSCDLSFRKPVQLTDGHRQQEKFIWGTAEPVTWTSLDGKTVNGTVFKPEDFDPDRKYPLIVNFYERDSDNLYSFRTPGPHRSTIDYHLYNSNGYVILNADIHFETGYPGESCYNCLMPGIMKLIGEGYIDENAIGAQGHSWGGYQVAYLATRTNLFAAIESGAPLVNMFNAYGGIRGETGRSRAYQYERGQSRLGGTMWETPMRYYENSPIFYMDKVETPILIMHNDADGHVPWHLGVEYFIALRRLQKPAWLLNYTGEVHWPSTIANRVDFQKRMFQFFDHYLKGSPMPKWMREGVPVIERDGPVDYL